MIKSILFVPMIILVIISIYSCNENSVIPKVPKESCRDSARFNWTADTVWESDITGDLWAPDTNNIFTIARYDNFIIRRNNGTYSRIDFADNEYLCKMVGDNINNGYLFGYISDGQNTKPAVWKWVGNGFVNIPTNNVIKNVGIEAGLFVSPTKVWAVCSMKASLLFDGSNFTLYPLPDSILYQGIFFDAQHKLKILGVWQTSDSTNYYILEFKNYQWEIIYKSPNTNLICRVFNNEVIGQGTDGIYFFDGQNFNRIIELCESIHIDYISGTSFNDFMGVLMPISNQLNVFFHWNGIKWSKEDMKGNGNEFGQLKMINNNFYVSVQSCWGCYYSIFYFARKK